MTNRKPQLGEILELSSDDPEMKKMTTLRDDFLQVALAQNATVDEYGSALLAGLAAVVYASAGGDLVARNKVANMVIEGLHLQFAIYDRAGGVEEARRRHLAMLRHG